ncbi:MAG TPA: MFS transporter, partial [Candidatus Melainabacteria bacterium]|nr:MFS transporter [Candidatus Melainabacteria bacterium]
SGRRLKEELPSLLVLGLIPAISSLGMSLHVPALNNMARCLAVDTFTAQSALSLYMLAFSVAIFASSFLADLVGKRKILLVSLTVSALASMLAAAASCFEVLLLARVLQAFAAGFIVVVPYAILQEMLSGRALSKTISFVSVLHSVAGATAP